MPSAFGPAAVVKDLRARRRLGPPEGIELLLDAQTSPRPATSQRAPQRHPWLLDLGSLVRIRACELSFAQNMILARNSPVTTATAVATIPGIMNEWLRTYLPILVVPERSKLIAAISEP